MEQLEIELELEARTKTRILRGNAQGQPFERAQISGMSHPGPDLRPADGRRQFDVENGASWLIGSPCFGIGVFLGRARCASAALDAYRQAQGDDGYERQPEREREREKRLERERETEKQTEGGTERHTQRENGSYGRNVSTPEALQRTDTDRQRGRLTRTTAEDRGCCLCSPLTCLGCLSLSFSLSLSSLFSLVSLSFLSFSSLFSLSLPPTQS